MQAREDVVVAASLGANLSQRDGPQPWTNPNFGLQLKTSNVSQNYFLIDKWSQLMMDASVARLQVLKIAGSWGKIAQLQWTILLFISGQR